MAPQLQFPTSRTQQPTDRILFLLDEPRRAGLRCTETRWPAAGAAPQLRNTASAPRPGTRNSHSSCSRGCLFPTIRETETKTTPSRGTASHLSDRQNSTGRTLSSAGTATEKQVSSAFAGRIPAACHPRGGAGQPLEKRPHVHRLNRQFPVQGSTSKTHWQIKTWKNVRSRSRVIVQVFIAKG